jgi:NAD-dependent SIR2 family protein deacetylase
VVSIPAGHLEIGATPSPLLGSDGAAAVISLLDDGRVVVLTGAGLSTDSGIPDYRGPGSPPRTPMTIAEFRSGPAARQRYWARSHLGWSRMRTAEPNGGHHALARLQAAGVVTTIITQNVDGLHQAAGSDPVVDLHGRLDTVVCLDCGARSARAALQRRLAELNPGFGGDDDPGALTISVNPDGDAEVDDTSGFVVAPCLHCGGILKPDVVFFGENVPPAKVRRSYAAVEDAGAMLVAGSSLTVMSGLRFVKRAAARGIPVVIVNRGATRGDDLADLVVDAGCTPTLQVLADRLA